MHQVRTWFNFTDSQTKIIRESSRQPFAALVFLHPELTSDRNKNFLICQQFVQDIEVNQSRDSSKRPR